MYIQRKKNYATIFPHLRVNSIDIYDVIKYLKLQGYKKCEIVSSVYEYSVRGDVLDVYTPSSTPVRILFDFDKVSSIKEYDTESLLTTNEVSSVSLQTNEYLKINKSLISSLSIDKGALSDIGVARFDKMMSSIELGTTNYMNIVFSDNISSTIYDYLPKNSIIAFNGTKSIYDSIATFVDVYNSEIDDAIKCGDLPNIFRQCKVSINTALEYKAYHTIIAYQYINQANKLFNPNKVFNIKTLPQTN